MSFASHVLLSCIQLATACHAETSPMAAAPLHRLLQTALPDLDVWRFTGLDAAADDDEATARILARLPSLVAQVGPLLEQPEQQAESRALLAAIEDLLTLRSIVHAQGCREMRVVLRRSAIFRFLNSVLLTPAGVTPLHVLAGDAVAGGSEARVRTAGHRVLENLEMAYRPGELFPCWRSSYFVRVPPNPARQRFAQWTPSNINKAATIEFYRSLFMAEKPHYRVVNEPMLLPATITSPVLELRIDPGEQQVTGIRTILSDVYRAPQLVVEHIACL
ncbi:MAG: hypothetical protein MI924_22300 [Chloroflexales bacterium]|nr:hypothetical protein [Chloroflexales bacterium]